MLGEFLRRVLEDGLLVHGRGRDLEGLRAELLGQREVRVALVEVVGERAVRGLLAVGGLEGVPQVLHAEVALREVNLPFEHERREQCAAVGFDDDAVRRVHDLDVLVAGHRVGAVFSFYAFV